jgi:isopenicillin-N epimerase
LPWPSAQSIHWRLDPECVFLNHGSFGATPTRILARQRELQDIVEHEPIRFFVETGLAMMDEARRAVALLSNADAEGIAHMPNATAGVNTVLRSLKFQPGDEILTNSHEYNACNNVLQFVAQKWGAKVVYVEPPFPVRREQEVADAILAGVTSRTKLVMLSHVTSPTALIMPAQRIVDELNRCGIDSLIDGAHAPGFTPIDIAKLNPTYYTGNFHKWLCAPKGAAFLYVHRDRRTGPDAIRPLVISHGANATLKDRSRFRVEMDYTGTFDITPYLCVPECIRFLAALSPAQTGSANLTASTTLLAPSSASDLPLESLGAHMRFNREQALKGRDILCRELGIEPPAPDRMLGAMAAVPLPDPPGGVIRPSSLGYHDRLWDDLILRHGIQVPIMPFPPASHPGRNTNFGPLNPQKRVLRISMQAYNSLEQVEYLAKCLKEELARERA